LRSYGYVEQIQHLETQLNEDWRDEEITFVTLDLDRFSSHMMLEVECSTIEDAEKILEKTEVYLEELDTVWYDGKREESSNIYLFFRSEE